MRTFNAQLGLVVILLATLCVLADSAQGGPFRNRRERREAENCACESAMYNPSGMVGYGSSMYYPPAPGSYAPYNNGQTSFYPPPYPPGTAGGAVPNLMPSREIVKIKFIEGALEPATLTVPVGTTVRWINDGKQPQTVTSVSGDWDSGDILPGKEFNATFNQPGIFEYSSRFQKNLKATIVVK